MKLLVKSLQSAIFTSGLDLSTKISLANQLILDTKELFDGEPIILPIPNDAPQEIPRIILKNKNESYSLNVGLSRIDFFYNERNYKDGLPNKEFSNLMEDFLDKTTLVTQSLLKISSPRVVRVGFILTSLTKVAGRATNFISEQYLKQKKIIKDLHSINLSILRKTKVSHLMSNVWFRVNPFKKEDDPLDDKVITIQFDVNTRAEDILDLKMDEIKTFFKEAADYVNKNIELYIQ